MTNVVFMWCRHKGDNVIGVDGHLPWCIKSDSEHFWNVVQNENVVCGRKTYEIFPEELPALKKVFVFSLQADYTTRNTADHIVVSSQKQLEDYLSEEDDIYVAGGAEIYKLFMEGKEKFKPHIVVDCVYEGDMKTEGTVVAEISDCISVLEKKYRKITPDYCADNVASAIWVRKGEFVEQKILKKVLAILEKDAIIR